MANSSYAFNLIVASQVFSFYCTYFNFGIGLIGNLLNILVFTNLKTFRHNRCAFYLIVESIVDLAQLTQMFANEMELMSDSRVWCKLKTMLMQWFRLMLASIVCFAAIDQFLCTNYSVYLRQISSLKLARRQICIATLLCLLHTVPFAVFLESHPPSGCVITSTDLINYFSFFFYPVLNGLLPIIVSSMFSLLAYRNVRRIVRRQIPIHRRRLDQQLTAMIFVRVIFFVLLLLPFTIYRICTLRLTIIQANTLGYAIYQWVQALSTALIYFNHAANFYIFFATSTQYRRQVKFFLVKKCWQSLRKMCHGGENIVQPLDGASNESGFELD